MALMTYTHLFSCGSLAVIRERLAEGRTNAPDKPCAALVELGGIMESATGPLDLAVRPVQWL